MPVLMGTVLLLLVGPVPVLRGIDLVLFVGAVLKPPVGRTVLLTADDEVLQSPTMT